MLIVQHAGDYGEAYKRLSSGGPETYFAQRYSVDVVSEIAASSGAVAVFVAEAEVEAEEMLGNGVLSRTYAGAKDADLLAAACAWEPTHVLMRTPRVSFLRWAIDRRLDVALTIADSFQTSLRNWLGHRRLATFLNDPAVWAVGNHGTPACGSLRGIGVHPDRIVAWDWEHQLDAERFAAKLLKKGARRRALYVGSLVPDKGVWDAVEAVHLLNRSGTSIVLDLIGNGPEIDSLNARGGADINVVGPRPNAEIVQRMHDADVVLVPSRHAYPEGFPLTIYEALASRTPIVASDHPMFVDQLENDVSAILFPAGDVKALAAAVERVLSNPTCYNRLSTNAHQTWQRLQVPAKWRDFLVAWLSHDAVWRDRFSLAASER